MFRMRPRLLMTERSRSGCWCRWCRWCRWGRAPGSRCSPQSGGSGGHNPDQAANIHNKRERESDTNTADSSWIFNKKRYLLDGYLEWLRTLDVLTLGVAEDGGGADQVGDQVVRDGDKLLVCVRITVEDVWHEDGDQEDDQDHDGDPWHWGYTNSLLIRD